MQNIQNVIENIKEIYFGQGNSRSSGGSRTFAGLKDPKSQETFLSLRVKTLVIICATFIILISILAFFSQWIVLGSFGKLEHNDAVKNVERAENALQGDIAKLDSIAYAWGSSPETIRFITTRDPDFIGKNFPDEKLSGSNINILIITDKDGMIIDHKYVSPEYGHQMPTPKSLLSQLSANPVLVNHDSADSKLSGIILLNSGPMMIASRPLVNPADQSILGSLIVGRYIDQTEIQDLSDRTQLALTLQELPLNDQEKSAVTSSQNISAAGSQNIQVVSRSDTSLFASTAISDIFGQPVLLLSVDLPRDIYQQGRASMQYVIVALIVIGLVFTFVMILILERTILLRLATLTRRIRSIGSGESAHSRIEVEGNDEISQVAVSVNGMLSSLATSEGLLRSSEERYRNLVETANDMIFTFRFDGRITGVNHMAETLLLFPREELLKKTFTSLVAPESIPIVEEMLAQRKSGFQGTSRYEILIVTGNGSRLVIEMNSQIQADRNGKPTGIFGIARNITERKLAEEELARHRDHLEELVKGRTRELSQANDNLVSEISERKAIEASLAAEKNRLEVTLSSIADGVLTTDTSGKIVLMNEVAAHLTGWTPEEAAGKPCQDVLQLIQPRQQNASINPIEQVLFSGKPVQISSQLNLRDRSGQEHPLVLSAAPIKDARGNSSGVVLVVRDITERLKWEEDLQRSAKLESIGTLAGGIAHDFNNILTAITGNIEIAKMRVQEGSPVHARLSEAEKATLRARNITRQLITFSKGGAPVRQTANISELIRENTEFVLRGTKSRPVISLSPDLCPVDVDVGQISQAINNLVINADQAMPNGGIIQVVAKNVTIPETAGRVPPGRYVEISVQDQGIGIPKENLEKIFDPWFTTKKTGTGLGLASTLSIIRKHDGYIDIDSVVGKGTTFHIFLPVSKEGILIDRIAHTGSTRGDGKVLIMDDDEGILSVTGELLRTRGYTVETARDGAEAIRMYKKASESGKPFDILLFDLTVPGGMGGKEAVRLLKDEYPDVKAIASSGYCNDPVMSDHGAFGFADVLPKPYKIEDLTRIICRHTRKKQDR
ncbi:MAG: PAS domain S-box protein [Methanoregulaceae archaeon]